MNCSIQPNRFEVMQTEFGIARELAILATFLDETKPSFPPALHEIAVACVQKMHATAIILAGDRAGEIYAPDDESDSQLIRQPEEEFHL